MRINKEDIKYGKTIMPRWYGLAYEYDYLFQGVYYPYPFNWIVKFWHKYPRRAWMMFVIKLLYDLGLRGLCGECQSKTAVLWNYIFGDIADTEANDRKVARILKENRQNREDIKHFQRRAAQCGMSLVEYITAVKNMEYIVR